MQGRGKIEIERCWIGVGEGYVGATDHASILLKPEPSKSAPGSLLSAHNLQNSEVTLICLGERKARSLEKIHAKLFSHCKRWDDRPIHNFATWSCLTSYSGDVVVQTLVLYLQLSCGEVRAGGFQLYHSARGDSPFWYSWETSVFMSQKWHNTTSDIVLRMSKV